MDKALIKDFIAKRVAAELKDGDVVNLGIGLPTMVPSFLPAGVQQEILQAGTGYRRRRPALPETCHSVYL